MFRTSSFHHQERLVQAVFAGFGMWYYCAYYSTRIATYQSLRIHLVQDAPDDGPMRSETCRANIRAEKTYSLKHFVYLVGLHIYYKMIHGPYNIKSKAIQYTSSMCNHLFVVTCIKIAKLVVEGGGLPYSLENGISRKRHSSLLFLT